jgi:hypothetical protein
MSFGYYKRDIDRRRKLVLVGVPFFPLITLCVLVALSVSGGLAGILGITMLGIYLLSIILFLLNG